MKEFNYSLVLQDSAEVKIVIFLFHEVEWQERLNFSQSVHEVKKRAIKKYK